MRRVFVLHMVYCILSIDIVCLSVCFSELTCSLYGLLSGRQQIDYHV